MNKTLKIVTALTLVLLIILFFFIPKDRTQVFEVLQLSDEKEKYLKLMGKPDLILENKDSLNKTKEGVLTLFWDVNQKKTKIYPLIKEPKEEVYFAEFNGEQVISKGTYGKSTFKLVFKDYQKY